MSDLNKEVKKMLNGDFSSIHEMDSKDILNICLNPANFYKLYYISNSFLFYEDDMEDEPNYIIDELLKCKDLTTSKHCILTIFRNNEISKIIADYDYKRSVSIYEKLIKCNFISDEDIIAICGDCCKFVIRNYYDDGDIYYTYTKLTDIFKYILENRLQYAKYLVAIDTIEFSFWYYHLLENKDQYSEAFKELLISNIYEFNRIQALGNIIILYGCNINYFDTILLTMEVIKKCSKLDNQQDINYFIFISLKIILCDVLPPTIYDLIFTDIKMKKNIYFILAFCYLNIFEGADIEHVKDFYQSIYTAFSLNIDNEISAAIEYSPNTVHLKKYNI
jgi:hypothetical protein